VSPVIEDVSLALSYVAAIDVDADRKARRVVPDLVYFLVWRTYIGDIAGAGDMTAH